MLKKTINFTDFDGNEQSEVHYFNLTKTELIELEASENGGLESAIQEMIRVGDAKTILAKTKEVVLKAYGLKSPDGKRFVKSEEIAQDFLNSAAYDALFVELVTDAEKSAAFMRGVIPDLKPQDKPANLVPNPATDVELPKRVPDTQIDEKTALNRALSEMTEEELRAYMRDRGIQA